MEEEETINMPVIKGAPFSSKNRSKPYTRRNPARVQRNWKGIYNLLGLLQPRLAERQDVHVALTNRVCEQHRI